VGVYAVYWFERQYRFQKRARGESTWPLARGIFSVFYANDLFKRVEVAARGVSIRPEWQPGALASIYVAAVVAGRIFHYAGQHLPLGSRAFLAFLSITSTVIGFLYVTMQVQSTVNDVLKREYSSLWPAVVGPRSVRLDHPGSDLTCERVEVGEPGGRCVIGHFRVEPRVAVRHHVPEPYCVS
jgi:hypothetical protein